MLALPGQGQAELLVVPGPGPAGQEEPGEVRVALAVGGQEQTDRPLEARARRIGGPRDARQRGDDGQPALLDLGRAWPRRRRGGRRGRGGGRRRGDGGAYAGRPAAGTPAAG